NLDQAPTDGVTGSTGPALLLRSVFAELTRDARTEPLYLSPKLVQAKVCVPMPLYPAAGECLSRDEWFLPGTEPVAGAVVAAAAEAIRLRRPTPGLQIAYDPRLPPAAQAFDFELAGVGVADRVVWTVDGRELERTGATYRWPVTRGSHRVAAQVLRGGAAIASVAEVAFAVK
ncbi:MAG: penicillin-binding protein 1C, partial [Myxococcota bacterium]